MKEPRAYLEEINANLAKMRRQGRVTAAENALLGMLEGLAGLQLQTMERLAVVEAALREMGVGSVSAEAVRRAAGTTGRRGTRVGEDEGRGAGMSKRAAGPVPAGVRGPKVMGVVRGKRPGEGRADG